MTLSLHRATAIQISKLTLSFDRHHITVLLYGSVWKTGSGCYGDVLIKDVVTYTVGEIRASYGDRNMMACFRVVWMIMFPRTGLGWVMEGVTATAV